MDFVQAKGIYELCGCNFGNLYLGISKIHIVKEQLMSSK